MSEIDYNKVISASAAAVKEFVKPTTTILKRPKVKRETIDTIADIHPITNRRRYNVEELAERYIEERTYNKRLDSTAHFLNWLKDND